MIATSDQVDWFRNNVGCYDANPACPHCGQRKDPRSGPRWIHYGVGGEGGSDLVGVVRATGRAAFIEVKTAKGRIREEQLAFAARVQRDGAAVGIARSAADVLEAIK
jgi:hypothetical protein